MGTHGGTGEVLASLSPVIRILNPATSRLVAEIQCPVTVTPPTYGGSISGGGASMHEHPADPYR